jgi:hypothetical protein
MVSRSIIPLLLLILISSGCATTGRAAKKDPDGNQGKTFADVYRKSKEVRPVGESGQTFNLGAQMGYVKPYLPVFQQPKVAKVWIPSHKSKDDSNVLVAGHWVFVMVEQPQWFVDQETSDHLTVPIIVPSLPQKD